MSDLIRIIHGDALEELKKLPDQLAKCCVTSPPYFGLRDYGVVGQIGLETSPAEYTNRLVGIFREVRRVLSDEGTLWLNLGDSYANEGKWGGHTGGKHIKALHCSPIGRNKRYTELKPKDLIGIPWRVALALQADGWYLRSDIIWAKSNCMPESVTDRPTRSHEYIFLMTKSKKYFYDHEAIKEPCIYDVDGTGTQARKARSEGNKRLPTSERNGIRPIKSHQEFTRDHPDRAENSKYKNGGYKNATKFEGKNKGNEKLRGHPRQQWDTTGFLDQASKQEQCTGMRNKRDVWMIAPANYPEAHFATFPPELIKPCILAGTKPGDIVLDPFAGSGTTGMVSIELGRKAVLIELNEKYIELIKQRTNTTVGFRF